jgi:hypothetical protein
VGELCLVFLRYEGGVEDYDLGVLSIVVGYEDKKDERLWFQRVCWS